MSSSIYVIDTNLFRYYSNDNVDQAKIRKAAMEFWSQVVTESLNEAADLILPEEVKQELSVQMHCLNERAKNTIETMISSFELEKFKLPMDLEYELRNFSNYVIQKYRDQIKPNGYKMEYLKTSDSRILVAAYLNDGVLVTANVKDFIVYLLFTDPAEEKLYDYLNKQYVKIPVEGRKVVEADPLYQSINKKMKKLLIGDEEELSC